MSKPTPSRVRMDGPLGPYGDGFRRELAELGYSSSPAAGHLQLMAHLSRWLTHHDLEPGQLTEARVERFVADRRSSGRVHRRLTSAGIGPLLRYLRGLGVVPQRQPTVVVGPVERLVEDFYGYLVEERGLAMSTVANYLTHREEERGSNVATRNARLSAVRSLFRYAALRHPEHAGLIQRVLAIPAKRHQQTIVSYLTADETDVLLAAPDQATWIGRRDHTLVARGGPDRTAGLRADRSGLRRRPDRPGRRTYRRPSPGPGRVAHRALGPIGGGGGSLLVWCGWCVWVRCGRSSGLARVSRCRACLVSVIGFRLAHGVIGVATSPVSGSVPPVQRVPGSIGRFWCWSGRHRNRSSDPSR